MRKELAIIFCGLACSGCAGHSHVPSLSAEQGYYLVCAVNEVTWQMTAGKIARPGTDQKIPRALWPAEIVKLHPVTVYDYDRNMVIVMQKDENEEKGYYVVDWSHIF